MKLRSKMSISILSVVFILFVAVIVYVETASSRIVKRDAEVIVLETVRTAASRLQDDLGNEVHLVQNLAEIIGRMKIGESGDRETVLNMLETGVTLCPRSIAMWIAFEPGAFDDRDADFAGAEWFGEKGQFTACFVENQDGSTRRTLDVTEKSIYDPKRGAYYAVPLKTGEVTISEPAPYTYQDGTNILMSSFSAPIKRGGKIIGVVGIDIDFKEIQGMVSGISVLGNTDSIQLMANGGTIIYAPDSARIGKNMEEVLKGQSSLAERLLAIRDGKEFIAFEYSAATKQEALKVYIPVRIGHSKQHMSLNAQIPIKKMMAEMQAMARNTIIVAGVGMILLAVLVVWLIGRVVGPIITFSSLMKRASELDFRTDSSTERLLAHKDEIGAMAHAYMNLQISLTRVFHSLRRESESFAQSSRNLAVISEESVAETEEVKASMEEVAGLSASNASSLDMTSGHVSEVAHSASSTAVAAENGAAAAAKATHLTKDAVAEVDTVVGSIRTVGARSVVSGESIKKVNTSVDAIAGFVSTITGIADQTNLLALNAAIEAARAGEAGRGFAVVAEEVRKLAEESGHAAQEVHKLISALQSDTIQASDVIQEMGRILEDTVTQAVHAQERLGEGLKEVDSLDGNMQTIAAAAQEQAAASSEMEDSVTQVVKGTEEVMRALNGIKSATDSTAAASENVAKEAHGLNEGVSKLQNILAMFRYDDENKNEQNARGLHLQEEKGQLKSLNAGGAKK